MKAIKTFTLLTVITIFITFPTITKAKDCSEYRVLSHKWNACQLGSDKHESGSTSSSEKKSTKDKSNSIWEKIKNFGGENIGEEG